MSESENRRMVVINSSDQAIRLVREIGEQEGFEVMSVRPAELKTDPEAIQAFLRDRNARVVVYEVAPPYAENWELFRRVRQAEMISGSWRQHVPTTPDKRALEQEVGATMALELAGDRADRDELTNAIRRGLLV